MTQYWFFYTPLCGTCATASAWLDILEASGDIQVERKNISEYPQTAVDWEITSVPCLMKTVNNIPEARMYAMQDITAMYEFLTR
ncbi:hypothetical protein [Alkalicoccus chagannorensis]|uniref:hypothetical protein n=1 Tax=Alkalicoccus chagannorensis TaxID=427072 RepID=UPI0004049054|nr:hypothetical protein [Alkalicoccus chagannorensis]